MTTTIAAPTKKATGATLSGSFGMIWLLAKRDLRTKYATSYGGVSWNIGVPLLNAATTVLVFSILMAGQMGDQYGGVSFPLFFFVPFVLWMAFTDIVSGSTGVLKQHGYLITKIAFPSWILPIVPFVSALLNQVVLIIIVGGMFVYYGFVPSKTVFFVIPLWMLCMVFAVGIAYMIAAMAVYIPDFVQAVPVFLNIAFWLTPILYPPSLVTDRAGSFVRGLIMDYNPLYYFVEISRRLTFVDHPIPWQTFGKLSILSFATLAIGIFIFHRLKPGFADVV